MTAETVIRCCFLKFPVRKYNAWHRFVTPLLTYMTFIMLLHIEVYTGAHHDCNILLPLRYANLLPARQDGATILTTNQDMNHHLPASMISYWCAIFHEKNWKFMFSFCFT